ncbi:MAG: hypothetical protein WEB78_07970 [Ilumatobacteraceae bacterium]
MYDDEINTHETIDWAGTCRLALVVSILAAASALLLSRLVGETALVVSVIVAGTMVSWFQLEHRPAVGRAARRD